MERWPSPVLSQGPSPVLSSTGPKMMEEGLYMDMLGIQARYGRSLAA